MSWATNNPIKFKLGTLVIWNRLTKNNIDLRDDVLNRLQAAAPAFFKDLIEAPMPTTMSNRE